MSCQYVGFVYESSVSEVVLHMPQCFVMTMVDFTTSHFWQMQVYLCPALAPAQPYFCGVIFQYVTTPPAALSGVKRSRRSRRVPLARGGRYDPLLSEFRRPGKQPSHPNVSVVGVSIMWEGLMGGVLNAYQQGNVRLFNLQHYLCPSLYEYHVGGADGWSLECLSTRKCKII